MCVCGGWVKTLPSYGQSKKIAKTNVKTSSGRYALNDYMSALIQHLGIE